MNDLETRIFITRALQAIAAAGEDYFDIKEIPGHGKCGIAMQMFTVGLFCGIDEKENYRGRYCYPDLLEARTALKEWDGSTPDPPGPWIKAKGFPGGERSRIKNEGDN